MSYPSALASCSPGGQAGVAAMREGDRKGAGGTWARWRWTSSARASMARGARPLVAMLLCPACGGTHPRTAAPPRRTVLSRNETSLTAAWTGQARAPITAAAGEP